MLFLYRPRETWMPFTLPRHRTDQAAYNRSLQRQFESTRRIAPPSLPSSAAGDDQVAELRRLRDRGVLTHAEFEAASERLGA